MVNNTFLNKNQKKYLIESYKMFPQQNWIIDFFLMFPFHCPCSLKASIMFNISLSWTFFKKKKIIKDKGIAAKIFNKHFVNGTTYSTMDQAKFVEDSLKNFEVIKGTLSGLRQFLTTESSLKIMENTFCFTSKAISVLRIFKFFSWLWSCSKRTW